MGNTYHHTRDKGECLEQSRESEEPFIGFLWKIIKQGGAK